MVPKIGFACKYIETKDQVKEQVGFISHVMG